MLDSIDHLKLAAASAVGLAAAGVDVVMDAHGWEDVSLKVMLTLALLFIGRLLLQQQKEHKEELEKVWEAHKHEAINREELHKHDTLNREERYQRALDENSAKLGELVDLTREQTDYFKAVTRNVVDERLKGKPQLPG
jgi:hypothetical protein